jgi:hypothetical protein
MSLGGGMTTGRPQAPPAGAQAEGSPVGAGRRLVSHPVVGFIPWVLFWVIGGPSTWETAAIAALLAAVLVLALSVDWGPLAARTAPGAGPRRRLDLSHLKLLDGATVAFFAALTVAGIVTSRPDAAVLDQYAQTISSGALGIIALGSMVAGHPFTVDYAREQTPREYWHTPLFRRVNLVLTGAWAAVFLICAGLGFWAQQTGVKGLRDWLNWYIPIALIFLAFRFTSWYPDQVRPAPAGAGRSG